MLSNSYFCQRDISNGDLIFFSHYCVQPWDLEHLSLSVMSKYGHQLLKKVRVYCNLNLKHGHN